MEAPPKSRTISRWRLAFRWCRITVWLLIFLAVAAVAYLHLVGMPEMMKRPLLRRLREAGFEAQFTSAWLGFGPDVVIENAAFRQLGQPLSPKLSAWRARVELDLHELLHGRVKVSGLRVQDGRLDLPVTGVIGDALTVNNVTVSASLLPGDTIVVDRGTAVFHGIHLSVSGVVTNMFDVADWGGPAAPGPTTPRAAVSNRLEVQNTIRHYSRILDQIKFEQPPSVTLLVSADGRDPDSVRAELTLTAPAAKSPWGDFQNVDLAAGCTHPMQPGPTPFVKLRLSAKHFTTPQAVGRSLELTGDLAHTNGTNLAAAVEFRLTDFSAKLPTVRGTRDATAVLLRGAGRVTFQTVPLTLLTWNGAARGEEVGTPWGSADSSEADFHGATEPSAGDAAREWGPWATLDGQQWNWDVRLINLSNPQFQISRLHAAGRWQAPEIELTNLEAGLYGGAISGQARLNAQTRETSVAARVDFDPRRLSGLLTRPAQEWMSQFNWDKPPVVTADARAILPPWTNATATWWSTFLPALEMSGKFSVGPASWRALHVDSTEFPFSYTNQVWDIDHLRAVRPEGELALSYHGSELAHDFAATFDSRFDPQIAGPFLADKFRKFTNEAVFAGPPPHLWGTLSGNWHALSNTVGHVGIEATNFAAHGEHFDGLTASVDLDRSVLAAHDVQVWKGTGHATSPLVSYSIPSNTILISNATGSLDTHMVPRLLGSISPWWLDAVGFDPPPDMQVNGTFVPGDDRPTDMKFVMSGRNFHFRDVGADLMSGQVIWKGQRVTLTNVQASLYGGTGNGWGYFDYTDDGNTDFRGRIALSNILLSMVNQGLIHSTNRLEGLTTAHFAVTRGNTRDVHSWVANGDIAITRAALWDIKLFGLFSRAMDAVLPGVGDSRAYQANAHFNVTNALLVTDDLEIRSTGFRLNYRGTVNTKHELDARVEARPLRNTPLLGPLLALPLSPFEKMFEYKIGGTVEAPSYRPLLLPKIFDRGPKPVESQKTSAPAPTAPAK